MTDSPKEPIGFQIKRVKDMSFSVNEKLHDSTKVAKQIHVTLDRELSYNLQANVVILTLGAFFYYESTTDKLASISVQNIFEIKNLSQFIQDNELYLPPEIIISLVSISLSHTRALFTKNLAGTVYQERLIPIINPVDITRHFFKYMFDKAEEIQPKKHAVKEIKGRSKIVKG